MSEKDVNTELAEAAAGEFDEQQAIKDQAAQADAAVVEQRAPLTKHQRVSNNVLKEGNDSYKKVVKATRDGALADRKSGDPYSRMSFLSLFDTAERALEVLDAVAASKGSYGKKASGADKVKRFRVGVIAFHGTAVARATAGQKYDPKSLPKMDAALTFKLTNQELAAQLTDAEKSSLNKLWQDKLGYKFTDSLKNKDGEDVNQQFDAYLPFTLWEARATRHARPTRTNKSYGRWVTKTPMRFNKASFDAIKKVADDHNFCFSKSLHYNLLYGKNAVKGIKEGDPITKYLKQGPVTKGTPEWASAVALDALNVTYSSGILQTGLKEDGTRYLTPTTTHVHPVTIRRLAQSIRNKGGVICDESGKVNSDTVDRILNGGSGITYHKAFVRFNRPTRDYAGQESFTTLQAEGGQARG